MSLSRNDKLALKMIGNDLLVLLKYALVMAFCFGLGYVVCLASNNLKIPFL